ncbi:MAG: hypothetical protein CMM58_11095 [Rhodospirillaceae bacterium]|nr:hypothetical protein [Rhodospirillaceae bacterium]
MLRLILISFMLLFTGCAGAANPYIVAGWVASEYIYDKPPLSFVSDFFGKQCKNYSIYEEPAKCRTE